MILISATEFRDNIAKYTKIADTEDVYITKRGRANLKISKIAKNDYPLTKSIIGCLKGCEMTIEEAREERLREKYRKKT